MKHERGPATFRAHLKLGTINPNDLLKPVDLFIVKLQRQRPIQLLTDISYFNRFGGRKQPHGRIGAFSPLPLRGLTHVCNDGTSQRCDRDGRHGKWCDCSPPASSRDETYGIARRWNQPREVSLLGKRVFNGQSVRDSEPCDRLAEQPGPRASNEKLPVLCKTSGGTAKTAQMAATAAQLKASSTPGMLWQPSLVKHAPSISETVSTSRSTTPWQHHRPVHNSSPRWSDQAQIRDPTSLWIALSKQ